MYKILTVTSRSNNVLGDRHQSRATRLALARFGISRENPEQRIGSNLPAWQRGAWSALVLLALIGSAQAYTRVGGIARNSATQIAAGASHGCALTASAAVVCWGRDDYGQLGTGPSGGTIVNDTPASAIAGGTAAISAGAYHTCAVSTGGGLQCWGNNANGQLGNSSAATTSSLPLPVSGLSTGVVAVAAGESHTCALNTAGAVLCWGFNSIGQLGNGSTIDSPTPVAVVGLPGIVIALAAGGSHTCAIVTDGSVWCWGHNGSGELGNASGNSSVPVAVAGLAAGATAITAGLEHTCVLTTLGSVQCWGLNADGEVGNGSGSATISMPATVTGLSSGVTSIGSGPVASHTCAVQNGSLWCWGRNPYGQLGSGNTNNSNVPLQVSGLFNGVTAVTLGFNQTYALTTAGGIQDWGYNADGELGNGNINFGNGGLTTSLTPVSVAGFIPLDPATVGAGEYHTCVLTKSGTPFCWGLNGNGQLGINTQHSPVTSPAAVPNLSASLSNISVGAYHACGTTTGGAATCWGYNGFGGLGNNSTTDSASPVWPVGLASGVTSVAAGLYHSCALTTAGNVRCWGYNNDGQVGNGNNTDIWSPAMVWGINSGVYGLTAGGYHTCTISTGWFAAECWGYNGYGQLGNNKTTNSNTPVFPWNLPNGLTSISAGAYHTCAVTPSGATQCWGYNGYGELGNGSLANSSVPTSVAGLSSSTSTVSAGAFHSCALTTAGYVQCWGYNGYGELGNGSTNNSATPVTAMGGAVAVGVGAWHSCAITAAGGVQCWGYNEYGELGDGRSYSSPDTTPSYRASPVIAVYAGQAITFAPPSTLSSGASVVLSASATSDLPVNFYTWTPSTCSIGGGNTLTITGTGLCGVVAWQNGWWPLSGPTQFGAAPSQLRLIRIQ